MIADQKKKKVYHDRSIQYPYITTKADLESIATRMLPCPMFPQWLHHSIFHSHLSWGCYHKMKPAAPHSSIQKLACCRKPQKPLSVTGEERIVWAFEGEGKKNRQRIQPIKLHFETNLVKERVVSKTIIHIGKILVMQLNYFPDKNLNKRW